MDNPMTDNIIPDDAAKQRACDLANAVDGGVIWTRDICQQEGNSAIYAFAQEIMRNRKPEPVPAGPSQASLDEAAIAAFPEIKGWSKVGKELIARASIIAHAKTLDLLHPERAVDPDVEVASRMATDRGFYPRGGVLKAILAGIKHGRSA
jgi:hypothetical protein